jgi:hypothetical protein
LDYISAVDQIANTTGFAIQLSNFSFVTSNQRKGFPIKKLRFSLVVTVDHPDHGQIAIGWDGCLAHRNIDGSIVWSPPLSRISPYKSLKTGFVNTKLHDIVLQTVSTTEYAASLGQDNWNENDRNPRLENPHLPEFVNV